MDVELVSDESRYSWARRESFNDWLRVCELLPVSFWGESRGDSMGYKLRLRLSDEDGDHLLWRAITSLAHRHSEERMCGDEGVKGLKRLHSNRTLI